MAMNIKNSNENNFKTFYFTFGTAEYFPFQRGWVEIMAPDMKTACTIFSTLFPNRQPGLLNCAFYYTEEEFKKTEMYAGKYPDEYCHMRYVADFNNKGTVSRDRLEEIIRNIVDYEITGSERTTAVNFLEEAAGVSKSEMINLGLDWLFDDDKITMEELNKVLAPLEFKAELNSTGLIELVDLQGTCTLEDEVFHTASDVIKRAAETYLPDFYLNGEICCNSIEDFNSFEEAERVAREAGYIEEADNIAIIIRALEN